MSESWWRQLRPQPLAEQAPLVPADVWKVRALSLVYPTAATILAITVGLSVARIVGASLFFGLWMVVQFLTLSPSRRRQILGMKPRATSPRPGNPG